MRVLKGLAALYLIFLSLPVVAYSNNLPSGFVYLREIDPTIQQDMRYSGRHNFIGRPIKGYDASECILTKEAATALAKAQAKLKTLSLSLKVYDCYRPQMAVDDFIAWSKQPLQQQMKSEFYPNVDKADLFKLGYIAEKSGHTRGSTVDVTVNNMDMGSTYDFMDLLSHGDNTNVSGDAHHHWQFLQSVMEDSGFVPYPFEWWHFTLRNEPFEDKYFNFKVESPPYNPKNHAQRSLQLMLVQTNSQDESVGVLQRYQRDTSKENWKAVGDPMPVAIGKNGLTAVLKKKEGDLKTPSGIYKIGPAFGFAETPDKELKLPYSPISTTTVCVDDSNSHYYNQIVDQSKIPNPDWKSAEKMRDVPLYKSGVIISYNTVNPSRGAGSCIFLHIWGDENSRTAGCIAVKENDLKGIMHWLDPVKKPVIAIIVSSKSPLILSSRGAFILSSRGSYLLPSQA